MQLTLRIVVGFILLFQWGCDDADLAESRKTCIDINWKFHSGDAKNAENAEFDDSQWRVIDLPHDWSIEPLPETAAGRVTGPFSSESIGQEATGHTVGGEAWYRKKFTISPNDAGKLFSLYFEGVYMEAEIWVNGKKAGYNPNGYTSFFCDIDSYCFQPGKENTIAIKVTNNGKNSRWYTGSGIYRHVYLVKTDKLHLNNWGPYITTNSSVHDAAVIVKTKIHNEDSSDKNLTIGIALKDSKGTRVTECSREIFLKPGESRDVTESLIITQPKIWDVQTPHIYSAEIILKEKGMLKDAMTATFGIRTIRFNGKEGFLLNNVAVKLRGGCMHHDNGILGSAAIDRAEERKVELLKKNGFNAVRCAHNPPSEKFLEACDRLGMLVIDEFYDQWERPKNQDDYHRFFKEWYRTDVESIVCRDRNHPSVIMWSIGNEIYENVDTSCIRITRNLKSVIYLNDNTRPITAAVNNYWNKKDQSWSDGSGMIFSRVGIAGYNYEWENYISDHQLFPDRIIYGSESFPNRTSDNWDLIEKNSHLIGDFVWTAMDYLGESGLARSEYVRNGEIIENPHKLPGLPWFNAWCGDIDLCGNKKPSSYYRDIIWERKKIEMFVHTPIPEGYYEAVSPWGWPDIQKNWNWPGYEGKNFKVFIYTKCPLVRLYLNGRLIGEKNVPSESKYTAIFDVDYFPGELKAVAIENSDEMHHSIIKTHGLPANIRLIADREIITSSPNELAYVNIELIDANGNLISDSNEIIRLELKGEATIAGSGNASPRDVESFRSLTPKLYLGKAIVIIRPKGKKGIAHLTVKMKGIPDATMKIEMVD